jgi:murein endopeptidase
MVNREISKRAVGQPRLRNALERIQDELDSLNESELLIINLDRPRGNCDGTRCASKNSTAPWADFSHPSRI